MRIKKNDGTIGPGTQIGTEDVQAGQNLGASITATGEAEIIRDPIEVIDPRKMHAIMDDEIFMNEFVVIHLEQDEDPNSPVFVPCGHNGTTQYIQRGTDQRIRRKFLYSLLAGKKTSFSCSFGKDHNGEAFNRLPGSQRTTYRLHVVRDDNPHGQKKFLEWMAQV